MALASCGGSTSDIAQATYTSNGSQSCRPGVTFFTTFSGFTTTSSQPVQVTGFRVLGADPGLRVVGVYAIAANEDRSRIGMSAEYFVKKYRRPLTYYPPSRAVLYPATQNPQWYFLIEVRATKVGDHWTSGVEVSDASGSQDFPDRIHIRTVAVEPHPDECPADI